MALAHMVEPSIETEAYGRKSINNKHNRSASLWNKEARNKTISLNTSKSGPHIHNETIEQITVIRLPALTKQSNTTVLHTTQDSITTSLGIILLEPETDKSTNLSHKSPSKTVSSDINVKSPVTQIHPSNLMTLTEILGSKEPTMTLNKQSHGTEIANSNSPDSTRISDTIVELPNATKNIKKR